MKHSKFNPALGMLFAAAVLVGAGCGDRNKDVLEYDRTALTQQLGDNVILPAYTSLSGEVLALEAAQEAFRAGPSLARLDSLQAAFVDAWLSWKPCSHYEFGPAASSSLRSALNTFPSDTSQIVANVTAGTWDLNLASNTDARGFPALDFMLFGLGSDDAGILARYAQPADSAHLHGYLAALVDDARTLVSGVQTAWQGSYRNTFKASLGTDVGSSTSLLVNELNRDHEIIKTASIGIPLGKQTFDTPLPEKVEGLYAGISEELAVAQLRGIRNTYRGISASGTDGYGLEEALDALEAEYNGASLSAAITTQFQAAENALLAMSNPLNVAVVSDRAPVQAAYTEIQKLVVLLKTDMASALSILITYTDSDGD